MENLKERRRILYESFDKIQNQRDMFLFQEQIAYEILECEKMISTNKDESEFWKDHLQKLYSLGDALVWTVIDDFTIRQLGKFESVETALISQEDTVLNLIKDYKKTADNNIYLLSDITRCITIGDVIEVLSRGKVSIHESKSSMPDEISAENLLRGRMGRQFSKALWLLEYMKNGFGKLYKDELPTRTIEIEIEADTYFDKLTELMDDCLTSEEGFAFSQVEPGLIYIAINNSFEISEKNISKIPKMQNSTITSTASLIEEPRETIFHCPPMAFPIPLEYRIMLNEIDINIFGILDLEYIKKLCLELGYEYEITKDLYPVIRKGNKEHKFHIRFINDILKNFKNVKGTVKLLTSFFEELESRGSELSEEEKEYIENRPKTKNELIEYLDNKYVIASIGKDGQIISGHTMNGKVLYENKKDEN